jgi:two-component system, NarL family, sensor histidine kinase YdfH
MEQKPARRDTTSPPFYIFISLLLGAIAVFGFRDLWNADRAAVAVSFAFLMLLHIGLFWSNMWLYDKSRWWFAYYFIQTLLIVVLVKLSFPSDINLTLLGSSVLCLIGESLGLWGNTRRAFYVGSLLFIFMVLMLYSLVGPERLLMTISTVVVNGGFIVLLMVMFNQQLIERQRAVELAESLESANARLAASAAKIETLTLQNERQRMARELHDTLAQGVAGLVLQLEAVKAHLASGRSERASDIVGQAIVHARSTLAESRAAIDDLRVTTTNLVESIREKTERFTQATGIPCDLEISVNENQLSPETTTHALNILNESLTNVARHAQASQVKMIFHIQGGHLQLEVRDNGQGFDPDQKTSGHYGLIGMHERARLTGGTLAIESNASGTCVQFIVGGAA